MPKRNGPALERGASLGSKLESPPNARDKFSAQAELSADERATFRNGNAAVCQVCGSKIAPKRASRRQRFCSRRCKKRNRPYSDLKQVPATPPADRVRSVANTLVISSPCKAEKAGRGARKKAFLVEIIDARRWQESFSSHGVRSFVSMLRPSAFQSGVQQ